MSSNNKIIFINTKVIFHKFTRLLAYSVVLFFIVIDIYPLIFMVFSSFKTNSEFLSNMIALPNALHFENYTNAWRVAKIGRFFVNSVYITSVSIILVLTLSFFASYIFARQKFRIRGLLYTYFIMGMLIPMHAILVPLFLLFSKLNLINKWYTLFLPYTAIGLPYAIYLFESFIKAIPAEIEESAVIDGANNLQTLAGILLPMCKPAIVSVTILVFINIWNDFAIALVLIRDNSFKTIQLGLTNFIGQMATQYTQLMAALFITTVPVLITYFIFQDKLTKGMIAGALKG
ncbi:MAG: carbohydrate ABC transporter permease [Ruminiclostridium sp.]|nr:carbohydrate ABC transporter permease [Ruminiclostridium sp.]